MKSPKIPMHPEERPARKRLAQSRTNGTNSDIDPILSIDTAEHPIGSTEAPVSLPLYLGQVEWAWSPMHGRIEAYYLENRSGHWLLWTRVYDDNWQAWIWALSAYARCGATSPQTAARELLVAAWRAKRRSEDLDPFHWVNEDGALSSGDLQDIAGQVWSP